MEVGFLGEFRLIKSERSYGKYCLTTDLSIQHRGRNAHRILCSKQGTFGFGTVKRKVGGEEYEAESSNGLPKFGTQVSKFGTKSGKLSTTKSSPLPSLGRRRRAPDPKTVFVAGATGQIGARISQQLLRSGFNVRGGVRDLYFAQQLAEFASQYGVISREEARRLNAVECDFRDSEAIAKAIGNAGKVVVTIGPTEDGPRGKVTPANALQVVEAASLANVGHIVIVCETGSSSKSRNPLNGIAQFFTRILSRDGSMTPDSLLESVVEMDLRFTFIKAGSTDVDDFFPNGSIVLLSEGTYRQGTGSVSKAQLASVVASVFENVALAENKVVEVASIASAEPRPVEELLSDIPIDGRRALLAEARSKAEEEERQRQLREQTEAEARMAEEEARRAAEVATQLEQEAKRIAAEETRATEMAEKAKAKAEQAAAKMKELGFNLTSKLSSSSVRGLLSKTFSSKTVEGVEEGSRSTNKAELGSDSGGKLGFGTLFKRDFETDKEASSKKPKFFTSSGSSEEDGRAQVSGLGKLLNRGSNEASSAKTKPKPSSSKSEPTNLLGGLFNKQEALYVDDDD